MVEILRGVVFSGVLGAEVLASARSKIGMVVDGPLTGGEAGESSTLGRGSSSGAASGSFGSAVSTTLTSA